MELSNSVTEKNHCLQREMNLLLNHLLLSSFESSLHRFNILSFCPKIWNSISSNFWSIPVQSFPAQKWLLANVSPCSSIPAQQSNSVQNQSVPNVYLATHYWTWYTFFSGAWPLSFQVFLRSSVPLHINAVLGRISSATSQSNYTYFFILFRTTGPNHFGGLKIVW